MIDWLLTHAFWVIFAVICAVLLIYGWWVRRTSTPEEVQAAKAKKAAWQEERKRAYRNPHYREPENKKGETGGSPEGR
jgi:hypothetical protein